MEIKERNFMSPSSHQPYFVLPPPPPPPPLSSLPLSFSSSSGFRSNGFNLNSKVSPSILLIIIILAIIFFVSGLLHLLVRFLLRPSTRDPDEMDNVTAFQGQLQQLFHLHDAGVDQSFIDTLPVFNYKAIIGVKTPFDCAVCLSEFESEDKLRLLPKCSHAFHMECIDTWLLSHSTCPLCRASLLPDFSSSSNPNPNCSPIVLVLESGSESSRELVSDREIGRVNSHLSAHFEDEFRHQQQQPLALADLFRKSCEIQEKEEEKIVQVKLGKFKNVDGEGSSSNSTATTENNVDERRCFSMGSFAYVMDDNTSLKVPIRTATRTPMKKQSIKKPALPLIPGHRPAMSECGGCDSRREFLINSGFFEGFKKNNLEIQGCSSKSIIESSSSSRNSISRSKEEEQEQEQSFSISKIWLRGKKDKTNNNNNNSLARIGTESSRRAFSFRFPPVQQQQDDHNRRRDQEDELKGNKNGRRTVSEIDIGRWENGGSEFGIDLEDSQSCNSLDSQANPPSFARRTLLWLIGRQNKVVHSTFSSNV